MIIGKMNNDVFLLGTDLKLFENDVIVLIKATNIPESNQYFARPIYNTNKVGRWSIDSSILINPEDFTVLKEDKSIKF